MIEMREASLALLATLATAAPDAQPAKSCVTDAEVRAAIMTAAAPALDVVRSRCVALAPDISWYSDRAPEVIARYRQDGAGQWQASIPVLRQMFGDDVPTAQNEDGFYNQLKGVLAKAAAEEGSGLRECAEVAKMIEPLSALPIRNLADFVIAGVRANPDDEDFKDVKLCPLPGKGSL